MSASKYKILNVMSWRRVFRMCTLAVFDFVHLSDWYNMQQQGSTSIFIRSFIHVTLQGSRDCRGACLYRGRFWDFGQIFEDPTNYNQCRCERNGRVTCHGELLAKGK